MRRRIVASLAAGLIGTTASAALLWRWMWRIDLDQLDSQERPYEEVVAENIARLRAAKPWLRPPTPVEARTPSRTPWEVAGRG